MIIDSIDNLIKYSEFNNNRDCIISFINDVIKKDLQNGRYELDGDRLFALVQRYTTKPINECKLESHKKYADLQVVITGEELNICVPVDKLKLVEDQSLSKDILFYSLPEKYSSILLSEKMFGYYDTQDGHMPKAEYGSSCPVLKIVFKIML